MSILEGGDFYKKQIDYSIFVGQGGLIIDIKNFFTSLLFQGIYAPSATYSNEYEVELGNFYWNDDRLYFIEKTKTTSKRERIDKILK